MTEDIKVYIKLAFIFLQIHYKTEHYMTSFHNVVVITSPLHGEGPQFDPEWEH